MSISDVISTLFRLLHINSLEERNHRVSQTRAIVYYEILFNSTICRLYVEYPIYIIFYVFNQFRIPLIGIALNNVIDGGSEYFLAKRF